MSVGAILLIGGVFLGITIVWAMLQLDNKDEPRNLIYGRRSVFALSVLTFCFFGYVNSNLESQAIYHGKRSIEQNPAGNEDHKGRICGGGWCFWLNSEKSRWKKAHIYQIKTNTFLGFYGGSDIRGYNGEWYIKKDRDIYLDSFIKKETKEN